MITVAILIFIAGLADGICDSIVFHDSYSYWGAFWAMSSWKLPKFMGQFTLNAWHIFKFLTFTSLITAIVIGINFGIPTTDPILIGAEIFAAIFIFYFGFIITYK